MSDDVIWDNSSSDVPWKNDEYNLIQFRVECESCGHINTLSCWMPSFIKVKDWELEAKCPNCNEPELKEM